MTTITMLGLYLVALLALPLILTAFALHGEATRSEELVQILLDENRALRQERNALQTEVDNLRWESLDPEDTMSPEEFHAHEEARAREAFEAAQPEYDWIEQQA